MTHPRHLTFRMIRCPHDHLHFMVDTRAVEPIYCPYCRREVVLE